MDEPQPHRERRIDSVTVPMAPSEIRAIRSAAERCNLPVAVWLRTLAMKNLLTNPVQL